MDALVPSRTVVSVLHLLGSEKLAMLFLKPRLHLELGFIWMDFERQQFIRFLDLLPRRKSPNPKNCVMIWSSQNSLH